MNIKQKVVNRLFGAEIKAQVAAETKLQAASMSDLMGPADMIGWRRLTSDVTRDLPPITQSRMIEISYWLWKTNPMANWIIEVMTAFVVGGGISLKSDDEKVQAVLDNFWQHPVNDMDINIERHVRELGLYGEQCWPKFTGYFSGKIALGYQDPIYIKDVITDPQNCKIKIGVRTMGHDYRDGKKYKIALHPDIEEFLSPDARSFRDSCGTDECYFFTINNVTNAPRGTSDLFVLADWLDMYEQFLFDYSEKLSQFNMFVWDLMVKGGDATKIGEVMKTLKKHSGEIWGHNENTTLEAKTPDFKAQDSSESARVFRNHVLGNKSLPEHWFGGGGDVNRASAMEMGTPVFKMMASRQKFVKNTLEFLGNDVIREADKRGMLSGVEDINKKCRCEVPEMVTKDLGKFGTVISQLAAALVQMTGSNLISRDTAIESFAFALALIGLEVDPETEKTAIDEDIKNNEQQPYKSNPSPNTTTAPSPSPPSPSPQPSPSGGEGVRAGEGVAAALKAATEIIQAASEMAPKEIIVNVAAPQMSVTQEKGATTRMATSTRKDDGTIETITREIPDSSENSGKKS